MNKKMRARKRRQARRVALTLVLMLTVALVSIGGTIAWLTDSTDKLTNTFTVGNIDITLAETKSDFKMVPGNTIDKDPKVTVEADSEACWLFVKIEESATPKLDDYISYTVANGWTELTEGSGIYWRSVTAADAKTGVTYSVLANDQVTVKSTVTKALMDAVESADADKPTLSFTAYAIQSENLKKADGTTAVTTAADAWALVPTA